MKADYQSDCRDLRSAMTDSRVDCSFAPSFQDLQDLKEFTTRSHSKVQDCNRRLVQCGTLPEISIDDFCAQVENSCAPVDNSCTPVDNSCTPVDNSCPPALTPGEQDTGPYPGDNPTLPAPPPEAPPELPTAPVEVPEYETRPSLDGGRARVELSDGNIPQELQRYAKYENGKLIIDAGGQEIPPLNITRDDVTIRNARIKGADGPAIGIYGANNVTVEDSEISGGERGILADRSSNVTVKNNWLHDMSWSQNYDTTAVEFDYVNGGTIEGNKVTGLYKSDAISMFESQNLRVNGNYLDITIDEWSSSPMMVEGNNASGIEITNNIINYPIGNNVPPGILGGRNHRAENNIVNGNRTSAAWQLYAYNDIWENIYFDGTKVA